MDLDPWPAQALAHLVPCQPWLCPAPGPTSVEGTGGGRIVRSHHFFILFTVTALHPSKGAPSISLAALQSRPLSTCLPGALLGSQLSRLPPPPPRQASSLAKARGDTPPARGLGAPVCAPVPPPAFTEEGQVETMLGQDLLPEIQPWDAAAALLVLNISFANNSAFNYARLRIHTLQIYGVTISAAEATLRIKPTFAFSAWRLMYRRQERISTAQPGSVAGGLGDQLARLAGGQEPSVCPLLAPWAGSLLRLQPCGQLASLPPGAGEAQEGPPTCPASLSPPPLLHPLFCN